MHSSDEQGWCNSLYFIPMRSSPILLVFICCIFFICPSVCPYVSSDPEWVVKSLSSGNRFGLYICDCPLWLALVLLISPTWCRKLETHRCFLEAWILEHVLLKRCVPFYPREKVPKASSMVVVEGEYPCYPQVVLPLF